MREKWEQKYEDLTIRKKILVVFITSFVFFMMLVLIVPNVVLYRSNRAKIEQNIQEECKMINIQINNLYNNMKNCWNSSVQGINQVYQLDEVEEMDRISFVSVENQLWSVLNYYKNCFREIDSLIFQDISGNIVHTGLGREPEKSTIETLTKEIPDYGPVKPVIFPVETREDFDGSDTDAILTLGVRVISIDTGNLLGYLFLNVKTSVIAEIFPQSEEEVYHKNYYIIDDRNQIIAARNPKKDLLRQVEGRVIEKIQEHGNRSFSMNIDNRRVLLTSRKNGSFNWTVVSQIPMKDIMRDIYYIVIIVISLGLLCMSFTVGILSRIFNSMVGQIQNLLEQVKKEQKQKRETELALFQIQIKPHFLYNTLDLIYVCCEMDEKEVAGRIAKALADYYRTCLSGGEEIVSVKKEIQNIENYLYIQRERYSEVISYKINVPQECGKYKIPKMTLQPLVENAIYHGLKEKDGEGCIYISVQDEGNNILLKVEDDGVGMSEQEFQKILQKKESGEKTHFGLKNVHERLQLYFGEEYGISLEKGRKVGTCIQIFIPKMEVYYD